MEWVVDRSIPVLFAQVDAMAPGRSKASDGTIGDEAHQARESDHNPQDTQDSQDRNDPDNQVDAGDITHDPAHGADMGKVSESIRRSRDRRVRYVIFNRRIFRSYAHNGVAAWTWTAYTGDNPHTGHMHISVNDIYNDERQPWDITNGDDEMSPQEFVALLKDPEVARQMRALPWQYVGGGIAPGKSTLNVLNEIHTAAKTPPVIQLTDAQVQMLADRLAAAVGDRLATIVASAVREESAEVARFALQGAFDALGRVLDQV